MTLAAYADAEYLGDVATNSGYSAVLTWGDDLDADDFPQLAHLLEYGWVDFPEKAAEQLKTAMARQPSDGPLAATLKNLLDLLGKTKPKQTFVISDGTSDLPDTAE